VADAAHHPLVSPPGWVLKADPAALAAEYGADAVRRLRVLAATVRFPVYVAEIVLPAPVEQVWAVASDLERELPRCLSTVRSARITQAEGDRLELFATGKLGQRARFDVVLRPGWCLMRSRFVLGDGSRARGRGHPVRLARRVSAAWRACGGSAAEGTRGPGDAHLQRAPCTARLTGRMVPARVCAGSGR
jgi:hypothetical protein